LPVKRRFPIREALLANQASWKMVDSKQYEAGSRKTGDSGEQWHTRTCDAVPVKDAENCAVRL
jgi:hypothetical protein